MRVLAWLIPVLLLAQGEAPFWVTRPVARWTDAEMEGLLRASPWAQTEGITVYFSTAGPVREAEREMARRKEGVPAEYQRDTDFEEFLKERGGEVIVVTVRATDQTGLRVAEEMARLERDSRIRSGKKILKLEALFPPNNGDPVLRLVFPRELDPKADKVRLELYIPAMDGKAWRTFEFSLKGMGVRGKVEI